MVEEDNLPSGLSLSPSTITGFTGQAIEIPLSNVRLTGGALLAGDLDYSIWDETTQVSDGLTIQFDEPGRYLRTLQGEYNGTPFTCNVTFIVKDAETQQPFEILLDTEASAATDPTGHYAVSTLIGSHTLRPVREGQDFAPASFTAFFAGDTTGVDFTGTTRRTLSGRVGGGCDRSIGTVTLLLTARGSCSAPIEYRRTISDPQGEFGITNLPPLVYDVVVEEVAASDVRLQASLDAYFDALGPVEVDLRRENATIELLYRAPLRIDVAGLPAASCPNIAAGNRVLPGVPVLEQGPTPIPLTIQVNEDYGADGLCPADTGVVTIFDEIADVEGTPIELALSNGEATYVTYANTPNVFTGRMVDGVDRSFQKSLTAVAEVGARTLTATEWVVVEGHRPREGTFVSYTTDEMPLLILRDPPGDQSYSYIEEGSTSCAGIRNMRFGGSVLEADYGFRAGISFHKGIGIATQYELALTKGIRSTLTFGHEEEDLFQVCVSTTERFATSGGPTFVGADADVFVGTALNLLFARTDVIEVEQLAGTCTLNRSESIAVGGDEDPFETTYVYTQGHIKNAILPRLQDAVAQYARDGDADSTVFKRHVDAWKRHLALNQQLKDDAQANRTKYLHENLSFSAGAEYEYTHTSDTTWSYAWESTLSEDVTGYLDFHLRETGFGPQLQLEATVSAGGCLTRYDPEDVRDPDAGGTGGACASEDSSLAFTSGYFLSDDDLGDFVTLDVRDDPTFRTPVFKLRSGTTSCPYEPGTQGRDLARLGINPPLITGVAPGEPGVFTLTLTNDSQSGEDREYHLRSVSTQNPGGAGMRANGSVISGGQSFFIGAQQSQEVTLEVQRGPTRYAYDSLAVMLYAPCEYQNWENNAPLQRADTVYFSVEFEAACSPVTLHTPASDWVVNADSAGRPFPVIIADLNLERMDELEAIGVQYRTYGTHAWGEWQEGFRVAREDLGDLVCDDGERDCSFYKGDWIFEPEDGLYQVRAYSICTGGIVTSEPVTGAVDVQPPVVFGPPEPADEVLTTGDRIALTFDEPVQCRGVATEGSAQNVWLRHADGPEAGTEIPVRAVCKGQILMLLPEDAGVWTTLEGRLLQVEVSGLADLAGNRMPAPYGWTFRVGAYTAPSRPAWTYVQPEDLPFASTMPVVARVEIDGAAAARASVVVSAWVEGELRGIAPLEAVDGSFLAFLSVGTDRPLADGRSGETVVFKIYDDLTGTAFDLAVDRDGRPFTLAFDAGAMPDPAKPLVLVASEMQVQQVRLARGWTWFSTNMLTGDQSPDSVLALVLPATGDLVKSQTAYSQFAEALGWAGPLAAIEPGRGYQVRLSEPASLLLPGVAAPPGTPVPISDGWNWIGYVPQQPMAVGDALQQLSPAAGDLVKNQYAYAIYDASLGWIGSLKQLKPGQGYQLFTASAPPAGAFAYPAPPAGAAVAAARLARTDTSGQTADATGQHAPAWTVAPTAYQYTMTVTAAIEADGRTVDEHSLVAALAGDEVRGVASPLYLDAYERYVLFLIVYANEAEGEAITFRLYDPKKDEVVALGTPLPFEADAAHGTPLDPYVLGSSAAGAVDLPTEYALAANYPNPFNPVTTIAYALPEPTPVRLDVYDVRGRLVARLVDTNQPAGRYAVVWDAHDASGRALASGVYFYRIQAGRFTKVRQMVLVK